MKIEYLVFLLMVVSLFLANRIMADVAVGSIGAGAAPEVQVPIICVWGESVTVDGVNLLGYRTGLYAFIGEVIQFNITVRDPNDALDIGFVKVTINDSEAVICNPITYMGSCAGLGGFDSTTDKAFECTLTVQPQWSGKYELKIVAYNSVGSVTNGTHVGTWVFNPGISMSVTLSSGTSLTFETGMPGDWVNSTNNITIQNNADNGVNLWVWIAGNNTGLFDPNGASKCPTTNVLKWHEGNEYFVSTNSKDTGMAFRGWTGSLNGNWTWMSQYDQNDGCEDVTPDTVDLDTCYGGKPVPLIEFGGQESLGNLLTNGGTMETEFKIHYPIPCIGNFSQGQILIFGKPV